MGLFSPSEPSLESIIHFVRLTDAEFRAADLKRIDTLLELEDKIHAKTATVEDHQRYKNLKGWQAPMAKAAEVRRYLKLAGWTPPPSTEE